MLGSRMSLSAKNAHILFAAHDSLPGRDTVRQQAVDSINERRAGPAQVVSIWAARS